ncbi:DUF4229 domain-containing protein [Protaetiibacter larvae]|uniref:DUF4229 domain-containing protein n=1 Tax=Protaetiibacter larvae TaxID=2592654 RepID=A0A5C1Y684_9MICO|nr:DUF4229 domain-containing protein [Protaetiibacter larvae]QEO08819.1 DUF4229 domain-containing protein [Protaetiibacter larvae]
MPAWIPYTLLRLALFGVTFIVLWVLHLEYWLAAIVAAVVGLTVSYIFFPGLRNRVAEELAASRERRGGSPEGPASDAGVDEQAEDRD